EGRYYVPIARRALVAVKARGGSIGKIGGPKLPGPLYRRYFLRGGTSLRGWGPLGVAPVFQGVPVGRRPMADGSTLPSRPVGGGHPVFESSVELRGPVWGSLSVVLFADAGNVWNNAWDLKLGDLKYDAGPGLRYLTPIGPIRVDVGFQLNRIPGLLIDGKPETRHFRVHFSIGQAF